MKEQTTIIKELRAVANFCRRVPYIGEPLLRKRILCSLEFVKDYIQLASKREWVWKQKVKEIRAEILEINAKLDNRFQEIQDAKRTITPQTKIKRKKDKCYCCGGKGCENQGSITIICNKCNGIGWI